MAKEKDDLICRIEGCNREVEFADTELPSTQCTVHNDRDIEEANERREWDHYHG